MSEPRDVVLAPTYQDAAVFIRDNILDMRRMRVITGPNGGALRGVRGVTVYLVRPNLIPDHVLDIVDVLDRVGDISVRYKGDKA